MHDPSRMVLPGLGLFWHANFWLETGQLEEFRAALDAGQVEFCGHRFDDNGNVPLLKARFYIERFERGMDAASAAADAALPFANRAVDQTRYFNRWHWLGESLLTRARCFFALGDNDALRADLDCVDELCARYFFRLLTIDALILRARLARRENSPVVAARAIQDAEQRIRQTGFKFRRLAISRLCSP